MSLPAYDVLMAEYRSLQDKHLALLDQCIALLKLQAAQAGVMATFFKDMADLQQQAQTKITE